MSVVDKDAAAPAVHPQAHTPPAGGRFSVMAAAAGLALALVRVRVLAVRRGLLLGVPQEADAHQRDLHSRPAGALHRPRARLRRPCDAGAGRVLRHRRLCSRSDGAGGRGRSAAGRSAARPPRRSACGGPRRLRDELPRAARLRPHAPDGDARRGADLRGDRRQVQGDHRRQRRPAGRAVLAGSGPLELRSLWLHGVLVFAQRSPS